MIKTHDLKTWPKYWRPVKSGYKRFELRRDDRNFHARDFLCLREWDPGSCQYTGNSVVVEVLYVLRGPEAGIPEGYALMSIDSCCPRPPSEYPF